MCSSGVEVGGVGPRESSGGGNAHTSKATRSRAQSAPPALEAEPCVSEPAPVAEGMARLQEAFRNGTSPYMPGCLGGVDLGVDLVAALRRQQAFMRHALEVLRLEFSSDEQAAAAVHEYVGFLSAMREMPVIVPTLATDLVWHVHMLFPVRYAAECRSLDCPQTFARLKLERQRRAASQAVTAAALLSARLGFALCQRNPILTLTSKLGLFLINLLHFLMFPERNNIRSF